MSDFVETPMRPLPELPDTEDDWHYQTTTRLMRLEGTVQRCRALLERMHRARGELEDFVALCNGREAP